MAGYNLLLFRRCLSINGFRNIWTSRTLFSEEAKNTSTEGSGSNTETEEEYEKNIESKILNASLKFVHNYGWSQQAISAGAESIGYPGVIHGMFPNGGADLVQHFYSSCNQELNEMLRAKALAIEENPSEPKPTAEVQVREAMENRLRMLVPYKKSWPQAMALLVVPPNVPKSIANILTLVDDICYYAGDRSVDFNWYTRRIVLAGIYKTTELYLLQDNSEDHKETWKFLERRIEDAIQLRRVLSIPNDLPPPDQALSKASEAASAAFITARNILGISWRNR
ncbi:ubiquinone biosynthesis protein COQ9, mitochondrial [Leptopilina heterotoma]|uniref:ubiquinone biosynthesis protein COQ9, mitochondrial n=1 Tax=Leptopilina heterotoma TaxID=63436 RepID=UPI001CA91526|nr:ubiquinone biosynthesis protein COQ9, mitochondrial [Leptopilina heterotoma]